MLRQPEIYDRLRMERGKIRTFVEEVLRLESPTQGLYRTVTRDTEIRDVPIKEGDKITLWYPAANRDPDQFPDPHTFDIDRAPNEHVAFGGRGPHFCLGANLARFEINCMFEELRRILPDMELTGPVERLHMNLINGIKHMPVKFSPVEAS